MTFNSLEYAVFLAVVVGCYWALPRRPQNVLLLIASYVFYGWWDWRFLVLIWVSTAVDYTIGRALVSTEEERRRRWLLAVSVIVNLGILGFFKYFDFFVDSAVDLLGAAGIDAHPSSLRIVLPVGISFYTFQTMSYSIDIFRRRIAPTTDFLSFAVFVAFFPQLVAGPIERARNLLPQFLEDRPRPTRSRMSSGLVLILIGLVKKVAIADALAPFVEEAFSAPGTAGWLQLLVGAYAFALQIYGDFSGYSSIARGSARLLGIDLMRNFEQPYLARSIPEFWRTWHISLSSWLRDYLYIPLGGNRGGRLATVRNLMLTMLLGGLWHGSAWAFVVWGGLHGLFLAVHRLLGRRQKALGDPIVPRDVLAILATFHLVTLAWIPFRASSFSAAWDHVVGILTLRSGEFPLDALGILIPAVLVVIVLDLAQRASGAHDVILTWETVPRGLTYAAGFIVIVLFSGEPSVPFIYFQF